MEDLLEAHLPEVVVDPVELRLVDVLVQLGGELVGGGEIVPERLLDDDARGLRQAGLGEPLDDPAEEERRDLEVEDRQLGAVDRLADALVGRGVAEIARDVLQARREALEDRLVELLAGADDRLARPLDELVHRPVVDRHADHRAVEQPALLEPVQRAERHHLREIAGDAEDDEDVGRGRRLILRFRAHAVVLSDSSSVTLIRPGRSWVNPAQTQSMTAFARSSPVESKARCTVPHASIAG